MGPIKDFRLIDVLLTVKISINATPGIKPFRRITRDAWPETVVRFRMTFLEWLQSRLNHHGAHLVVDGIWGPRSTAALRAFQRNMGIEQTGIADDATVGRLRLNTGQKTTTVPAPAERMPVWLAEMTRRMGLHEVRNNYSLSQWLRSGRFLGDPARLPWCGDAVETCFARTLPDEALPDNPFWAQAWKGWGVDARGPKVGSVGVIRWSARAGHVGLVIDSTATHVKLRGGNQGNMVKDAWFPLSKFIAFRWPETVPLKNYPPVTGSAGSGGGAAATR